MTKDRTAHDHHSENQDAPGAASSLAAVSGLMDERRRFEAWIATLEAKRATTADHVFARVHADYTTRLEAVLAQLTTHAGGLRTELDILSGRLSELEEERQHAQDERAEAELRAHVGELSSVDWEQTAAALDAKLSDLTTRHAELSQELTRTRELLVEAERPVTPPAPVLAVEEVVTAETVAAHEPPVESAATAPEPESEPAPYEEPLVISHHTPMPGESIPSPEQPAEPAAAQPSIPRAPAPPRASRFDELAFLSSVVDTPSGSIEPGPTDRADENARRDSFAMHATDDGIVNLGERGLVINPERADPPLAVHVSGNLVPRDKSDGAKTLKCSECGSMNYPTEWYCERCGAELASL